MIVPFAGTCEHRRRAWDWIRARYAHHHPTWSIIIGTAASSQWSKAEAVGDALRRSTADILVIADADVWVDALEIFATDVEDGLHDWACPHRRIFRFNEQGTKLVLADINPVDVALARGHLDQSPYSRMLGGGVVILPRESYERCPLDPRFTGWGGEDQSWGYALSTVAGKRKQGEQLLWHLWHPPQERLNRKIGSMASERLRTRYQAAAGNVEATTALIEEGRAWRSIRSS